MAKNVWFKHYNEAHDGNTMSQLWAEKDFEAIAFYWAVLEMVSRWEDPEKRGSWTGKLSIFKTKLGLNCQKSRKLLLRIALTFKMEVKWNLDESFTVFIPNWSKLQETRGGKREAKTSKVLQRKEERGKRKEERTPIVPQRGMTESFSSGSKKLHWLAETWNQLADPKLPRVIKLDQDRQRKIKRRLEENPEPEFWYGLIAKINASAFCTGQNSADWKASFDYLIAPKTWLKAEENAAPFLPRAPEVPGAKEGWF